MWDEGWASEGGMEDAGANAEGGEIFLGCTLALAFGGICAAIVIGIAFPWYYPTYHILTRWVDWELHTAFLIIIVIVTFIVNTTAIFILFRFLWTKMIATLGAVQGAVSHGFLFGLDPASLDDRIWYLFSMSLFVVLFYYLFYYLAERAKGINEQDISSLEE